MKIDLTWPHQWLRIQNRKLQKQNSIYNRKGAYSGIFTFGRSIWKAAICQGDSDHHTNAGGDGHGNQPTPPIKEWWRPKTGLIQLHLILWYQSLMSTRRRGVPRSRRRIFFQFFHTQAVLNINYFAVRMVIIALELCMRRRPPFGQYCIIRRREIQYMGYVGRNREMIVLVVKRFVRTRVRQRPHLYFSRDDNGMQWMRMQVARSHHAFLTIEKIQTLMSNTEPMDISSIVHINRRHGGASNSARTFADVRTMQYITCSHRHMISDNGRYTRHFLRCYWFFMIMPNSFEPGSEAGERRSKDFRLGRRTVRSHLLVPGGINPRWKKCPRGKRQDENSENDRVATVRLCLKWERKWESTERDTGTRLIVR